MNSIGYEFGVIFFILLKTDTRKITKFYGFEFELGEGKIPSHSAPFPCLLSSQLPQLAHTKTLLASDHTMSTSHIIRLNKFWKILNSFPETLIKETLYSKNTLKLVKSIFIKYEVMFSI
jgi:hypothetical protein